MARRVAETSYYAVASIWGYEGEGAQWEYAVLAAGELLVGGWLVLNGFPGLRAAVRMRRHP